MSPVTCPDNETLKSLLLGKLTGSQLSQWEEHLLHCESCASKAETLDGCDALTEAIAHGNFPSGDEEVLGAAIEQAKRLISGLDTIKTDETLTVENPSSQASSFESQNSRYKVDFLAPAEQPDELGRLGDYRVLKVLGVGGMGMVFKGEDIRLGRLVALKVMRPGIAAKPDAKARFLREAKATASLSHDHIVQIYQVGEHDGVPFIAMQYLAGESLETSLKRVGKLPDAEVIRIGKEVALGLAAAHEAGMVHRDIKPDNVWMEQKTDRAKILDFGLVRDDHSDQGLTQSGTILGTPRYMAPEQVAGDKVDRRADLFSLGSMLYHLAAGSPPFSGSTIPSLLFAITQASPQPLAEVAPSIHPPLADMITRLLSKEPEHRPQSAEAVAKQFARIESAMKAPADIAVLTAQPRITTTATSSANRRPPARPWPLIAAAGSAAFALLLGVIVITIRSSDGKETKIQVPSGTTTTLDLAPGSEVTIQEASVIPGVTARQAAIQSAPQLGSWSVGPQPPWFGEGGHDAGYSIIGSDVLPGIVERPTKFASIRRWNVDTKWGRGITLAARYSPDGKYLAVGNTDGHVRVFDADSMELRSLLPGKTTISGVDDLSWAPDSQRLVVAIPNENVARIWSIDGRVLLEQNSDVRCHSVAWSPDGKWIAEGHHGRVQLRRPDGTIEKVLCQDEGCGPSTGGMLVWHPDGRHLASWRHNGKIVIWDCDQGTFHELREPIGHRGFPGQRMAWSGSGILAVVLGDRMEIYGPDYTHNQTVDYRGRGAIAWHPDNDRLFMWDGGSVLSWSVCQEKFVDETSDAFSGWPHQPLALTCSPDGQRLAMAAGLVRVLSSDLQTKHFETPVYCRYNASIGWTHDGKYLASTTVAFDSGFSVWDASGKAVKVIPVALETLPLNLTWSPTDYTLVGTASGQPTVISRDMGPASVLYGAEDAHSVAWSSDGTQLAFGTGNGTVKIFTRSGKQITEMIAGDRPAFVAWSAAIGELWVHCGHRLYRCDPKESWSLTFVDETSEAAVTSPSWCPDGQLITVRGTGWYSREGKLVAGPNRRRPITWRHDGDVYISDGGISLSKHSPGGAHVATRYLNGFFEKRAYQYQPFGSLLAVGFGESVITALEDEDLQPYWHTVLLPDMQSATFSAAGQLIDGAPNIVEPHLVYYYENEEGKIQTATPAQFRTKFESISPP